MRTIKFGQTNGTIILKESSIGIVPSQLATPTITALSRTYDGILDAYVTTVRIYNMIDYTVSIFWAAHYSTYPTNLTNEELNILPSEYATVSYSYSFNQTIYFRAEARKDEYITSNKVSYAY